MASLLDIGRSAVNAQREALNVTGQNIVNANTEGYRRRDASLSEAQQRGLNPLMHLSKSWNNWKTRSFQRMVIWA